MGPHALTLGVGCREEGVMNLTVRPSGRRHRGLIGVSERLLSEVSTARRDGRARRSRGVGFKARGWARGAI